MPGGYTLTAGARGLPEHHLRGRGAAGCHHHALRQLAKAPGTGGGVGAARPQDRNSAVRGACGAGSSCNSTAMNSWAGRPSPGNTFVRVVHASSIASAVDVTSLHKERSGSLRRHARAGVVVPQHERVRHRARGRADPGDKGGAKRKRRSSRCPTSRSCRGACTRSI